MPTAKINLHTHDNSVSFDSSTPIAVLERVYSALGYDAIGVVGHDNLSDFHSDRLIVFNGVEETVSEDPEIHVLRFEELGSFLAHPKRITDADVKETARSIINDMGLNGVEKFSGGVQQYEGDLNTIQLANDDAHNLFQVGTSFMEVEVNEINRGQIVQAVRRGDLELKNRRPRVLGEVIKTINVGVGSVFNGQD